VLSVEPANTNIIALGLSWSHDIPHLRRACYTTLGLSWSHDIPHFRPACYITLGLSWSHDIPQLRRACYTTLGSYAKPNIYCELLYFCRYISNVHVGSEKWNVGLHGFTVCIFDSLLLKPHRWCSMLASSVVWHGFRTNLRWCSMLASIVVVNQHSIFLTLHVHYLCTYKNKVIHSIY
jgi:hypothetical protein